MGLESFGTHSERHLRHTRAMFVLVLLIATNMVAGCGSTVGASQIAPTPAPANTPQPATATPVVQPTNQLLPASVRVPILMYHHISDNARWPDDGRMKRLTVQPEQFTAQLDYLQQAGYTTITLDELATALQTGTPMPAKPVILTFDDGYKDFATKAFPLLQRYQAKATIFIISGRVDETDYLTWDDLRTLAASPLITVGAHTRNHPQLTKIKPEHSFEELEQGKTDPETNLQISVHHLAYPSGNYNDTTVAQATKIGYTTAVTVHYGVDERATKLLRLPRVFVNGGTPLADFVEGLEGKRT